MTFVGVLSSANAFAHGRVATGLFDLAGSLYAFKGSKLDPVLWGKPKLPNGTPKVEVPKTEVPVLKAPTGDGVASPKAAAAEKPGVSLHVIQKSCFTSGTPIVGRHGSKRIEEFRGYKDVGDACDWVVSRSEHNDDGPLVLRRVLQTFERLAFVLELRVDGRLIGTTAEHPFFVRGKGWTTAQEIRAGDEVRLMEPGWATIEDVRDTGRYETVYNLEVEEDHTYFVGGEDWDFAVWAHNEVENV